MTATSDRIVFTPGDELFARVLRQRVDDYFDETTRSRLGGWRMIAKTLLILGAFAVTYALLLSSRFDRGAFVLIVVMHFLMFQMTIGIAHDATHRAYARRASVNERITYLFDLLGIDSQYWIQTHVHAHHSAPNVPEHDSAIASFALARLNPRARHSWVHRYQHLYMFGIYSLITVFQVFFLELVAFRANAYDFRRGGASATRLARICLSKAFVLTYSVLVPVFVLPAPAWQTLLACLVGHMVCGLAIGVIFQTTHLAIDTEFPEPDALGRLPHSYVRHVLLTTADVAPRNRVFTFIAGGLNIHVAHHLFPRISQMHLPAVARIVKQTALEHGMPYRELGIVEAISSHVAALKRLGRMPELTQDRRHPQGQPFGYTRAHSGRVPGKLQVEQRLLKGAS